MICMNSIIKEVTLKLRCDYQGGEGRGNILDNGPQAGLRLLCRRDREAHQCGWNTVGKGAREADEV